jgi:hypothetical protein
MSEAKEGTVSLTKPVTLTFPNLDEARAVKNKAGKASGDPKFSVNLEFDADSTDLADLKAEAVKVARAKWPGVDVKTLKFPFTSGTTLADKAKDKGKDREFSRGKAVLTARSKYQPRLSTVKGGAAVDIDGDDKSLVKKLFYSGCQVLAQVNFQAYDAVNEDGKDGVTAYINMVMSLNKGTRLTGGASAAEVFKSYIGTATDEDPTAGEDLDDEIPF